jgi:DNA-binding SARP family transcriptional activator
VVDGDGRIQFRILGPLEVRRDGELLPVRAGRQRALLGLLLLRANEVVATDELIEELWGPLPPRTAKASLHNHVAALRRLLGQGYIETSPPGYRIEVHSRDLDKLQFQRLVEEARDAEPTVRVARLREALGYWRGLPLIDFPAGGSAQAEIVRLEEMRLVALEERIETDLALARHTELVAELEALVLRHPLRERLWHALMLALYRSGRQAEALETYRRAHRLFVNELGIEPSHSLKELQRAVLVDDQMLELGTGDVDDLFVERAIGLLPTDQRARAEAMYEYGVALWRLAERRRSEAALKEAARRADEVGDRALAERTRLTLSRHRLYTQPGMEIAPHLQLVDHAIRLFEELADAPSLANAYQEKGVMLRNIGHASEGAIVIERAIEVARVCGHRWQEGMARNMLGYCIALGPTPVDAGVGICEQQLAAIEWGPPGPIGLWMALALLHAQAGRFVEARNAAEKALAATREAGLWGEHTDALQALAEVELAADELETAVQGHRSAYEPLDSLGDHGGRVLAAGKLGRALALAGRVQEAEHYAAIGQLAGPDDFMSQVAWRRAQARALALRGALSRARMVAQEAAGLAMSSDFTTLQGEALEDLAWVCSLAGWKDEARRVRGNALAAYRQKGNGVGAARIGRPLH